MIFTYISSEDDVMPLHIFEQGFRLNSDSYVMLLETGQSQAQDSNCWKAIYSSRSGCQRISISLAALIFGPLFPPVVTTSITFGGVINLFSSIYFIQEVGYSPLIFKCISVDQDQGGVQRSF